MRSIYSGVSGLKNMQTGMDIIANNISNVNTTGYKASRISFQDILSQTLQGASAATGNRGGTNPMQIGLGMAVASTDTLFTDGTPQPTGKGTDLAIQGSGFFVLSDGANQMYTRAGGFDFDTQGNYVLPGTGFKVMGWQADNSGVINTTGQVQSLVSPVGKSMPAKVSTQISYGNNLSADAAIGSTAQASRDVYDSLGNAHKITTQYFKVDDNKWLAKTSVADPTVAGSVSNEWQEVSFNSDGTFQGVQQATPVNNINLSFNQLQPGGGSIAPWSADINGVTHTYSLTTTPIVANASIYTLTDTVNGIPTSVTGNINWGTATVTGSYSTTDPAPANLTLTPSTVGTTAPASGAGAAGIVPTATTGAPPTLAINFNHLDPSGLVTSAPVTAVDSATGHTHKYTVTTTPTGVDTWSYSISDTDVTAASPAVVTNGGAVTWTLPTVSGSYTVSNPFPTTLNGVPINILPSSNTAPAAGAYATGGMSGTVASDITIPSLTLDSTAGSSHTQNFTTIINGQPQTYAMTFTKATTPTAGQANSWNYSLTQVGVSGATPVTGVINEPVGGVGPYTGFPATIGGARVQGAMTYSPSAAGAFVATPTANYYNTSAASAYTVQFTGGATKMTLAQDSTKLAQFSGESTVQATDQNGYAAGTLDTTTIDTNGILIGKFTNGQTQNLAQVALATFNNPSGLTRSGNNMFVQSTNSGTAQVGVAGSGGRGTFSPGSLEGSNVDLAQQFSDMIITERAYQANSKIISTSDEMLQDLNNLKR